MAQTGALKPRALRNAEDLLGVGQVAADRCVVASGFGFVQTAEPDGPFGLWAAH